jgi:hypothetical protein
MPDNPPAVGTNAGTFTVNCCSNRARMFPQVLVTPHCVGARNANGALFGTVDKLTNFLSFYASESTALRLRKPVLTVQF